MHWMKIFFTPLNFSTMACLFNSSQFIFLSCHYSLSFAPKSTIHPFYNICTVVFAIFMTWTFHSLQWISFPTDKQHFFAWSKRNIGFVVRNCKVSGNYRRRSERMICFLFNKRYFSTIRSIIVGEVDFCNATCSINLKRKELHWIMDEQIVSHKING